MKRGRDGRFHSGADRLVGFHMHVMKIINISGKIGQTTVNRKKVGGRVVNLNITQPEADKIIAAVMAANTGKLKAMMFDYGLNAKAQAVMAYTPPGSVEWKEKMKDTDVPAYDWTEADTEEYLETLRLYGERERTNGFSLASRQATWDKKMEEQAKAAMASFGVDHATAWKHLMTAKPFGPRPEDEVENDGADEVAAALA